MSQPSQQEQDRERRAQALALIRAELRQAARQGGRALFLVGPPGSGKSALLARARRAARWRTARLRTALVDCGALPAGASAWARLARAATAHLRAGDVALNSLDQWVNLVPVVGDVVSALIGSARAVLRRSAPGRSATAVDPGSAAAGGVALLLRRGRLHPRLLVLDSLDRASAADLAATSRLLRELAGTRTLLLVGTRGSAGHAAGAVEDLILEGERLGLARRLGTDGGRGTQSERPGPAEVVSPGFAAALPELSAAERALLAAAARLGASFTAGALAGATAGDELEVEDALARLARRGVLRFQGSSGTGEEETSRYTFADVGVAKVLAASGAAA